MIHYPKCTVNGEENYLNDLLIELPYYDKSVIFEFEGKKFNACPKEATEFCMDYSRDNYSQCVNMVNVKDGMKGLLSFMNHTGYIVKEIED